MTDEQRIVLKNIYVAYKSKNIDEANKIAGKANPETIEFLLGFFDYENRPAEYSSGKGGKIFWLNFEGKLSRLGYSEAVSKIIPGVVMDNYNEVLDDMFTNKTARITYNEG